MPSHAKQGGYMTFFQAVGICFKKYVTFSGRATRSEFWYWTLFTWLLSIAALTIDSSLETGAAPFGGSQLISTLVALATFLPGLAVSIRRLHDVKRSGWWFLVAFTGIGLILLLYWAVVPSRNDGNEY
jgi:uncharacterized membrane protein YhaH (DUF805 family)